MSTKSAEFAPVLKKISVLVQPPKSALNPYNYYAVKLRGDNRTLHQRFYPTKIAAATAAAELRDVLRAVK